MNPLRGPGRILALAAAAAALVAACSGSAASPSAAAGITVTGAWIRAETAATGSLAAYMTITNTGSQADTLLSASCPIAKTAQLHETVTVTPPPTASAMPGASGMPGMSMPADSGAAATGSVMPSMGSGMMTMVQVPSVDIPAGGTVAFQPGGYHVMLMDLTASPIVGQSVDLTLVFKNAGSITVQAELRDQ